MKSLKGSFAVFFLLFSFSILLVSCSQESGITAPNESNLTALAKVASAPIIHLNHSSDTSITLPKSKIQVVVNKNYPNDNLTAMDTYYALHSPTSTPITPLVIQPNCRLCANHVDTITVLFDQYQPAPGKNIGISPLLSAETPQYCFQWGFNQIIVSGGDPATFRANVATAEGVGYTPDNIGVWLPEATAQDLTGALNIITCGTNIGYYLIDEPIEVYSGHYCFGGDAVNKIVNYVAPAVAALPNNAKLVLTTYRPTNSTCSGAAGTGGTLRDQIAAYFPNTVRIWCDQYHGNCCGNVGWFWNDYAGFYGTTLNPTNFMDVSLNNGSGRAECTPSYYSSDFSTLFTNYQSHGDNTAWLYAGTDHPLSGITDFMINVAYQKVGWAVRYYGRLVQTWQYTGGDCSCQWGVGQWTLINSYYKSYGWAYY